MESPESRENQESVVSENSAEAKTPTFEEQVNAIVSKMSKDEKGNYQLPEGDYSEEVKFAANAERRRRSTESALSKTVHKLKATEAVKEKLRQQIASKPKLDLTKEQQKELNDLRYEDPEAWRSKINELEDSARVSLQEELDNYESEASQQSELDSRIAILEDFNKTHDIQITDDIIESELPLRIVKKLEKGEISFKKFLEDAYDYLKTSKVIGSEKATKKPNLGEAGGSKDVPDHAQRSQDNLNYKNITF